MTVLHQTMFLISLCIFMYRSQSCSRPLNTCLFIFLHFSQTLSFSFSRAVSNLGLCISFPSLALLWSHWLSLSLFYAWLYFQLPPTKSLYGALKLCRSSNLSWLLNIYMFVPRSCQFKLISHPLWNMLQEHMLAVATSSGPTTRGSLTTCRTPVSGILSATRCVIHMTMFSDVTGTESDTNYTPTYTFEICHDANWSQNSWWQVQPFP